jgi:hypothetical protein
MGARKVLDRTKKERVWHVRDEAQLERKRKDKSLE